MLPDLNSLKLPSINIKNVKSASANRDLSLMPQLINSNTKTTICNNLSHTKHKSKHIDTKKMQASNSTIKKYRKIRILINNDLMILYMKKKN